MKPELNTLLLLEEKETRIAELEGWKAQAMTVLGDWSALFDALPDNYTQQPKFLGSSLSVIIGGYIMELQDDVSSMQELRKKWGGDTFGHLPIAEAFDAYCDAQSGCIAQLEAENARLRGALRDSSEAIQAAFMEGFCTHKQSPAADDHREDVKAWITRRDEALANHSGDANKMVADGWQTMETAPKDGSVFVAFEWHAAGGFQFMCTCSTDGRWISMMNGNEHTPIRWRLKQDDPVFSNEMVHGGKEEA
jgi:hypothetical protein